MTTINPSIAPGRPYSFPHIDFKEQVVGPLPFEPYWRNTIGVAGEFSRGPAGPVRISSREEFAYLFGEDLTPGSVFVRQAMLQGATNFVISRVMPGKEPSYGVVFLQSATSPATVPPLVGPSHRRTVGLRFEMRYIGEAISFPGEYIGSEVRVERTLLTIPGFEGTGFFDFTVVERVDLTALTTSGVLEVVLDNVNGLQLVSVSGLTAAEFVNYATPGRRLVIDPSNSGGSNPAASLGSAGYLTFVSKAYERLPGVWSALVEGEVTGVVDNTQPVLMRVPTAVTPPGDYYVIAANYRSGDGALLPSDAFLGRFPRPRPDAERADFYLTVTASNSSPQHVRFVRYNSVTNTYTWHDTGIQIAFGRPGATTVMLVPRARFTIPFIAGAVQVGDMGGDPGAAFAPGMAGLEILRQLSNAIMSSDSLGNLIAEAPLNELLLPYTIRFRSAHEGAAMNRIAYRLSRNYVGSPAPDDVLFGAGGVLYDQWHWMEGGESGLQTARRYLYDAAGNPLVLIEALSPGSYGNDIRISVRPMPPGQFRIEVVDERGMAFDTAVRPEAMVLSNYTVDRNTGLYPETLDSRIIRAYFVPVMNAFGAPVPSEVYDLTPQRIAPPVAGGTGEYDPSAMGIAWMRNLYLQGGTDQPRSHVGEPPTEKEFLTALRALEYEDCAIIAAAGIEATDVRYEMVVTELIAQAERATTVNGLRVAVLQAPRRVSPARAPSLTMGFASSRAVMVAGHCSFVGMAGLGANAVPSVGIYAGVLAANEPHVSPASLFMGRPARGVVSVDTRNDPPSLDVLTRARLEVLHYDQGVRQFKFLNGITTSIDPYERYISVRRMMDQIIMDIYRNLVWVRSAPHTRSLRARVASAVDAYLRYLQREERIYRFQPTICNESNNSILDMSRGRLNVRVTVTPVYPADFIFIDLVRDLTAEFSINTVASL